MSFVEGLDAMAAAATVALGTLLLYALRRARRAERQLLRLQASEPAFEDAASIAWIARIRNALDHDGFVLHSQRIVDLETGADVAEELLIRMRGDRSEDDLILPGEFLPVAERTGLVREIDCWVAEHAAALAVDGRTIQMNVSSQSVGDHALTRKLESELERHGADPNDLILEITETAALESPGAVTDFAARVERLGCRVALDDFGMGYGTVTYLKELPVSLLKLDVELVADLQSNPVTQRLVPGIVGLAEDLGHTTVAEGIEDVGAWELLRECGVDQGQGWYFGRPRPVVAPPHPEEQPCPSAGATPPRARPWVSPA